MTPLEKKIISDFNTSDFIVCTDAGLSSTANRKFNSIQGRGYITTQSIKKLKGFLQDFCLADDGWFIPGEDKIYKLSELDEKKDSDKVFYKHRWINEDDLEQHLIVTYSIKYRDYQRTIRERQIERAKKYINKPSSLSKRKRMIQNDLSNRSIVHPMVKLQTERLFLLIRNRLKMKLNMMDFMPYVQIWITMFRISSRSTITDGK